MKKLLITIFQIIAIVATSLLILFSASILPMPINLKIYSVMSGSMEPAIKTGSLVFVKPEKAYGINDIVTIQTKENGKTVTHRITGIKMAGNQTAFNTKGDANKSVDGDLLLPQNIIGKVFFSLPFFGYFISFSKTLPGLILIIILPTIIIIFSEFKNLLNEIKKKQEHRKIEKFFQSQP